MICKNNNSVFKEKLQYFVNRTTENISSQDDKNKGLTATDSNIGMPSYNDPCWEVYSLFYC